MMSHLIDWLLEEETNCVEIRAFAEQGIRILIQDFLCFLTVFIFAFCFGCVPLAVQFIILHSVLRVNTGGWHADTRTGCIVLYLSEFIVCYLLRKVHIPWVIDLPLVLCTAYIFILSPFQHVYNPLSVYDQSRRRYITRIICIIYLLLYELSKYFTSELSVCIYCVICFISLLAWVQRNSKWYLPNGENDI